MAYEALYTRARPKNLSQLVGQEHISNSLANALNQDRLSHAYLLVGTRGTGKTSTARILAKAINCDTVYNARNNKNTLPANEMPCNKCESCLAFERSPDNVEFDAASNRSVEDVSKLLSTAYLAPLQSRVKTFIIDEVHMLSFEAVNSILKLIEEPPDNVVFFLATTEFNKVPMTIRSRCQILNFKLIPPNLIETYICQLAKRLNTKIEEAAAVKISRMAKGSMRDALTFFDQCYSMSNEEILTEAAVNDTLGLISDSDLDAIINAINLKERGEVIECTAKVFKSGLTAAAIAEALITRLRDIVTKITDSHSPELSFYNNVIDELRKSVIEMQGSGIPEIILETALLKLVSAPAPLIDNFADDEGYTGLTKSKSRLKPLPPANSPVVQNVQNAKVIQFKNLAGQQVNTNAAVNFDNNPEIDQNANNEVYDEDEPEYNYDDDASVDEEDLPNGDLDNAELNETVYQRDVNESDYQPEKPVKKYDGSKLFDIIFNYYNARGRYDEVECLTQANLLNFTNGTFTFRFKNRYFFEMFRQNIAEFEKIIKEMTGEEIKFKITSEKPIDKSEIIAQNMDRSEIDDIRNVFYSNDN